MKYVLETIDSLSYICVHNFKAAAVDVNIPAFYLGEANAMAYMRSMQFFKKLSVMCLFMHL